MVGTVKKSTETICERWFSRKVRQVCDGGLRQRTMYLLTLLSPMSMPSLSSSPWMRGAPQPGFSRHIWRIRSRTSHEMTGRPGWPCRTFQVQNRRKPARCQATTDSGLTMVSAERQSLHRRDRQIHNRRSLEVNFGRLLADLCSTPIWTIGRENYLKKYNSHPLRHIEVFERRSRNSCATLTFQPPWTITEMHRSKPSGRPIGQSSSA